MTEDFEYLKKAGVKVAIESEVSDNKITVSIRFGGVFGTFIATPIKGLGYQVNAIGQTDASIALTLFGALRLAYTKAFCLQERLQYAQTNGHTLKEVFG